MSSYKPVERIVDRAVELWKRMLRNPKYDHGDLSPVGLSTSHLAEHVPSNATDEVLCAFGEYLKNTLMTPVKEHRHEYYHDLLGVDYGPDAVLCDAASKAGLEMEFPWKTNMTIDMECVSVAAGYRAERVYHYPLADGRWLVTTLCGSDISKIIAYCEGKELTLEIEGK